MRAETEARLTVRAANKLVRRDCRPGTAGSSAPANLAIEVAVVDRHQITEHTREADHENEDETKQSLPRSIANA